MILLQKGMGVLGCTSDGMVLHNLLVLTEWSSCDCCLVMIAWRFLLTICYDLSFTILLLFFGIKFSP